MKITAIAYSEVAGRTSNSSCTIPQTLCSGSEDIAKAAAQTTIYKIAFQ